MAESPLLKKLGMKPDQKMLILNAPEGYTATLGTLPEGSEVKTDAGSDENEKTSDFVQVFLYRKADLDRYAAIAMQVLKPRGLLWFSYSKKSSKVETDMTRDIGWERLKEAEMRRVRSPE